MDRISHLYDELLLRILSLLPAKDVVETMVLSKRWQFLWKFVPKLMYDDSYKNMEYGRFSQFVEKCLVLHEVQVIETLHFKLGRTCGTQDIGVWINKAADKHCVRELIIEIDKKKIDPVILPTSLYTCYKMLVTLKLSNAVLLVDDVNSPISFPSLKKLSLKLIKFPSNEFFNRLLSGCPVLEDFAVEQHQNDNVPVMSVRVPSLKHLVLSRIEGWRENTDQGFVIDAASLERLDVFHSYGYCVIENDLTKIVSANLAVLYWHDLMKLRTSLTLAKRLYLCVPTSKDVYPVATVFNNLVHLKICTCETEWLNLLMRVLSDSPNLQALKLVQCHYLRNGQPRPCWTEPSSVPECLVSRLETFEWINYDGTQEEKELAMFILRSTSCLKKATIIPSKTIDNDKKLEMTKELSLSARRSAACPLTFS